MEPFYRIAALAIGLLLAFAWMQFASRKRKQTLARRAGEASVGYWTRPPRINRRSRSKVA